MSNNKYKILVVEDDRNILSIIQTVLETNGYQVLTAQRCQQGILMLTSHMPDLVVLDLGLPDMDGEEFIRVARRSSMIPIIVVRDMGMSIERCGGIAGPGPCLLADQPRESVRVRPLQCIYTGRFEN